MEIKKNESQDTNNLKKYAYFQKEVEQEWGLVKYGKENIVRILAEEIWY